MTTTDYGALRALAETLIERDKSIPFGVGDTFALEWCDEASPATVLALLDANERLRGAIREALDKVWGDTDGAVGVLRAALGDDAAEGDG